MKTSFVSLILVAATLVSAETYRDPQQRYQLEVPAGWASQAFGQGVSLSKGNTYLMIMEAAGAGPAALDRWTSQFAGQWTNTQEVKSGSSTLGSQPAAFRLLSGVNPKGVSAFLKITVTPSLVLIASAPASEFAAAKAAFEQIERSFAFRGGDRMTQGMTAGYGQNPGAGNYGPGPGAYGQGGQPPAGSAFAGIAVREAGQGQQGVLVGMVAPNGPAARAGIQPGDLILAVNRNPVRTAADIPAAILACRPGDILELVIVRHERPEVVKLKLEARQ